MNFSQEDRGFIEEAINEAKKSFDSGDFPVGAVLVINGKAVAADRNSIHTNGDWVSHAEMKLLSKYSSLIKEQIKNNKSQVTLYTSLEPCLMCFGTSILNRITRIVYACPDPFTGSTHIDQKNLPKGYNNLWPKIEGGLLKESSYELLTEFMRKQGTEKWKEAIDLYEKMKEESF